MNEAKNESHGELSPVEARLLEGGIGPLTKLGEAVNLSLEQVSEWVAKPQNRHRIKNLVTLLDAQTQLMVCQHRLVAVARLIEVASTAGSPETVRRACKDLLNVRLIDPYKEDTRPETTPPPPEMDEEKALAIMEAMVEADDRATAASREAAREARATREAMKAAAASNNGCHHNGTAAQSGSISAPHQPDSDVHATPAPRRRPQFLPLRPRNPRQNRLTKGRHRRRDNWRKPPSL